MPTCKYSTTRAARAGMADGRPPSYGDIAKKLLDDRLLLTALELHYELVEAGKELPKLREFFSDPSNFEQTSPQNDSISMTLSMGEHTLRRARCPHRAEPD